MYSLSRGSAQCPSILTRRLSGSRGNSARLPTLLLRTCKMEALLLLQCMHLRESVLMLHICQSIALDIV
jgi:hypothetical protein